MHLHDGVVARGSKKADGSRLTAGGPKLDPLAAELLTRSGLANAAADLYREADGTLDRDEVACISNKRQILMGLFAPMIEQDQLADRVNSLERELRETQRLVKSQQGSASTSFDDRPPIPHKDGRDPY